MVLVDVEEDATRVFAEEGKPIENLMIIEEGTLSRTKVAQENILDSVMTLDFSSEAALEESVTVDEIEGTGRVTGLLHIIDDDERNLAFATVWAKGPAKVWLIPASDFREIISAKPEYALDMMGIIAQTMRVGSKSLRGLIKSTSGSGAQSDSKSNGSKQVRVLCYDSTSWVKDSFAPAVEAFNEDPGHHCTIKMDFTQDRLSERSATYAAGYDAVCLFVNDTADANVLRILSLLGVKMIAMRCAGFDRVDTKAAKAYGVTVARVPAYSPYAVAEHAIALLMSVNRKIATASTRVKMANFTLDSGLMGIDIHGKTVGVMGTGKIGQILINILRGFGANIIAYDVFESDAVKEAGGRYVSKEEIYAESDVIFLMMPLLPATRHTICDEVLPKLKRGVLLINTARGGLIDTKALISGLQSGVIGGCGLDVFENEAEYFFQDWSARNIEDPELTSLLGNNKVVLTAHQAFFTKEAIDKIVSTSLENLRDWKKGLTGQKHPNNCIFDRNSSK